MAFTGQSNSLHILAGILSLDNLFITGETPLLVGDMLVKVREGRRAANFLKLCVFLHYTAISEHI